MPDTPPAGPFRIRIAGREAPILCRAEQKLLFAIEEQVPLPNPRPVRVGCRKGGCGACRIKVISGDYVTAKMSRDHVTESEEREGYALACRLTPQSDLEIETAFLGPLRGRETQQELTKV